MQTVITAIIQRLARLRSDFRGSIEIHVDHGRPGDIRITEHISGKDLQESCAVVRESAEKERDFSSGRAGETACKRP